MEKLKETQKIIEEKMKFIAREMKPIIEENEKLCEETTKFEKLIDERPLIEIMSFLTKTSRKQTIEEKIFLETWGGLRECTIGTNHNGIGYITSYGTQLVAITDRHSTSNEKKIIEIINNEKALIELTTKIKKCNQKDFLKVINIIKKQKKEREEINNEEKYIEEITIKIANNEKIIIDTAREGEISINNKLGNKISNTEILLRSYDNMLEEKGIMRSRIELKQIILLTTIIKEKKEIIKALKERKEKIKKLIIFQKEKDKEINDLLKPIKALENL